MDDTIRDMLETPIIQKYGSCLMIRGSAVFRLFLAKPLSVKDLSLECSGPGIRRKAGKSNFQSDA